jgi:hypothetical protein
VAYNRDRREHLPQLVSNRAVGSIAVALAIAMAPAAHAVSIWTLDVSGVWKNGARVQFNPTNGNIGNMGVAGVSYSVGAPPANAQVAARAAVSNGFEMWNKLAAIPSVKINYVLKPAGPKVNIPVTWGALAGAPGEAMGAPPKFSPDPIVLNSAVTLRTDGWNLDYTGAAAPPGLISEYDIETTSVHESGHTLGLGHPQSVTQIMTPQDTGRQAAGGSWQTVLQTTPFAGQPLEINGAAQPNGSRDYRNPRLNFGFGDALGAITLYSAPIAKISSLLTLLGGGRGDYSYTMDNSSALGTVDGTDYRSAYDVREVDIPVSNSLPVTDLVAPADWTLTRESGDIVASYTGSGVGLLPGQSFSFSFDSVAESSTVTPDAFWSLEGFGPCGPDGDDSDGCADPQFDPTHFGVGSGGRDTYVFDDATDSWDMVALDGVITPVPEPAAWLFMLVGMGLSGAHLRSRRLRVA